MRILFVGDIMPGGVLPYQDKYLDDEVLSYMHSFDLRVGTLECGVGENIPFDASKYADDMSNIFVRNEDLVRLKDMNINIVTLANNHAFDLGLQGFENAAQQLSNLGILFCGAGHNIDEAKKPAQVLLNGKRVAFVGCMIEPPCVRMYHVATDSDFGVYQVSIDHLVKDIIELKLVFDYVFVLPHWGEEHSYYPPAYCKECAQRMIEAGADAVVGSHPHVVNPFISYKGKPIYYSLGNFLFPDKCMKVPRPVYYPLSNEECKSLRRVWTYPRQIKENVIAVWHGKNRIGMMAAIIVSESKIFSKQSLTKLAADNVLHLENNSLYIFRFKLLGLMMRLPKYGFVRRCLVSKYNIVRRLCDKSSLFNVPVDAEVYYL